MSDESANRPNQEQFLFVVDRNIPANQHMVHHLQSDTDETWHVQVEWITPDALPAGTQLDFALFLKPTGPRGVVRYMTPLGSKRVLIVHAERAVRA
jgi:hypothetical protein